MPIVEEVLRGVEDVISDAARRGLLHLTASDERLTGRSITVAGQRLVNFGSSSYLGLETHPEMVAAVADATERYGTQFSSSRVYVSAPQYAEAERLLSEIFGRPALVTSSTTLGHLAALPTLVGSLDALVLDHQVHQSVQTAAKLAQVQGSTVTLVRHSDMAALDRQVEELSRHHRRVWYAADGLYSMYADFLPAAALNRLVERYPRLWLYIDDAHAVSWSGRHGRGYALEHLSGKALARSVVAGSLNKSFAAAGGVLLPPDEQTRGRIFTVGGPMIFSGPVQPPMLGAIVASARLHQGPEVARRQRRLRELIGLFNELAAARGLPMTSSSTAPIRCVGAGPPVVAFNLVGRLRDAGYFVDTASFPAVAAKRSGARLALTTHHRDSDIVGVVDALAAALPAALADEGSSAEALEAAFGDQLAVRPVRLTTARPPVAHQFVLEHHSTVEKLDGAEWDALFSGRGAFTRSALRALEGAFAAPRPEPEHSWDFHYWLVRDQAAGGRPVAATFATTALWKDDMLAPPEVSAEVERLRLTDPYYLTSPMLSLGCLLTEGDHLYLNRTADWRVALRLILDAARAEEERAGAAAVVLRDLPDDPELHDFLLGSGFFRTPLPAAWVREVDFADDAEFLAGLPAKARRHRRNNVLANEAAYRLRVVTGGDAGTRPDSAELDHLYQLYLAVHRGKLDLNVFPLPRRILDAVVDHPRWELLVLRLDDQTDRPVAFVAQHVDADTVAPLFLGLDYRYVRSHHCYEQALWQAIRSAQRHGARRVLLGMGADLQKARFGAVARRSWVYLQPTETYQADLLGRLSERVASGRVATWSTASPRD